MDRLYLPKPKNSDIMIVLKKFGFSILLLAVISFSSFAQSTENCEKSIKTKTAPKIDPIDFVQNHILNGNTQAGKTDSKIICKENNTVIKTKTTQVASSFETKKTETKKTETSFADGMLDWVKEKYSAMIDVMPNQISNVMLYRFIDEWYGVRYRMGGTSKSGVDCSAFVQHLYQYVFGFSLLRTASLQFSSAKYIKDVADLKEGDLVFFRVNTSRISHVGVYLRNNFFVHSACSKGVSIASIKNAYWSKYFAGGGRVIN